MNTTKQIRNPSSKLIESLKVDGNDSDMLGLENIAFNMLTRIAIICFIAWFDDDDE